jgi:hypothetical protein
MAGAVGLFYRDSSGKLNKLVGTDNPLPVQVILPLESNGAIPVNVQDQTTPPVDLYFIQAIGDPTTLAADIIVGDTDVEVTSAADFSIDSYMGIFCPDAERFYFGTVLAVNGTTITVDTPVDFAFHAGDNVISATRDLEVSGSLASPEIFQVSGAGSGALEVDITRIIVSMILDSQPDDGLFGNVAKLDNGIVLRRVDGTTRNIWNVKENGDFATLAYDVTYTARTVPQGSYGMRCRYTFAGQDKHGVAVRLSAGDSLQILVQDDLTDITQLRILAAGHVVTD